MKILSRIILSLVFMLSSASLFGWGEKGHSAMAFIAQEHLTRKTERRVARLLDGHPMAYWASWADGLRGESAYDAFLSWHYANVEDGQSYARSAKNPLGDVVTAVQLCTERLGMREQSDSLRSMYLKLLIHFVGDLHCPMHAGRKSDMGGNLYSVVFRDSPTNLHRIWDSSLIDAAHDWSGTEWGRNIDVRRKWRQWREIQAGTPRLWMEQTVFIRHGIYADTPQEESLSWDYVDRYSPVIESQLLYSGYRLAGLLNEIFGGRRR
jgi:hypothetical protein